MEPNVNGGSSLQRLYMAQKKGEKLHLDRNIHYSTTTECATISSSPTEVQPNVMNSIKPDDGQWRVEYPENKTNYRKPVGGDDFCCANYKTFLVGLLIGLLVGSIALAMVITMRLTSTHTTSTNTTSYTTTTSTSSTSTTSDTTTTSTTSTSTTSDTTSTSTTSTSTTSDTTTVTTTTVNAFTPSTVSCSSTVATPCTTTTTIVANCQSYEVSWNNHCYYLDGSASNCTTGYSQSTNAVLTCIATQFAGKTYRSTISGNCCIWTADTYQCYIMSSNCNTAGPFTSGPSYGCTNLQQRYSQQLTFCGSN